MFPEYHIDGEVYCRSFHLGGSPPVDETKFEMTNIIKEAVKEELASHAEQAKFQQEAVVLVLEEC
jgi:hypothetical protein